MDNYETQVRNLIMDCIKRGEETGGSKSYMDSLRKLLADTTTTPSSLVDAARAVRFTDITKADVTTVSVNIEAWDNLRTVLGETDMNACHGGGGS